MDADREIMQLVQAGQTECFDELVRRHRSGLIRAAVSKLRNQTIAEEAVQDAFLAAFAKRHTFRADIPEFSFRGWLWTILLNICRNLARRELSRAERPVGEVSNESVYEVAGSGSVLNQLIRAEQAALLEKCLDRIPEVQADALRLRFFGGLKFAEIAQAMDCSENGAKLRVRNGLERLAASLKNAEITNEISHPAREHKDDIGSSAESRRDPDIERDHQ